MFRKILENILLPLFGFLINERFIFELRSLRKIIRLSEQEILDLQKKKLMKVLVNAVENVKYYNKVSINKANDAFDNLKKFPILKKEQINLNQKHLISKEFKTDKLITHKSSGSTGEQTTVFVTKREQSISRATQILWWECAGYKIGQPILQTGINPKRSLIKNLKDFFFRTYYINAFNHNDKELRKSLMWAKNKNAFFAGYASSLFVYSKFSEKNNLNVEFSGIVSFGDKLFNHYKESIKKNFKSNIYETYGSAEMLMMGFQMDLDYMYEMSSNVYIEILDDYGNELPDGKLGNIVVTNLNSFAMPLIRYRIGDIGIKLPKNKYPNARKLKLPLIQKIIGRDTDIVKTYSGKKLVVHSFTGIFEHIPQIKQFCIIQKNLHGIDIKIIPGKGFNRKILSSIEVLIKKETEDDFMIKFILVKNITPTKSGKPQIIISKL